MLQCSCSLDWAVSCFEHTKIYFGANNLKNHAPKMLSMGGTIQHVCVSFQGMHMLNSLLLETEFKFEWLIPSCVVVFLFVFVFFFSSHGLINSSSVSLHLI